YLLSEFQLQSESGCDGRQEQSGFHHSEFLPDTEARAGSERKVGAARQSVGLPVLPSLRSKRIGVRKPARMTLDRPLAGHDHSACGNRYAADLAGISGLTSGHP